MMFSLFRRLAAAFALVALSGCRTTPEAIPPSGSETIAVDPAKNTSEAATKLNTLVTIVLPPAVVDGYVWRISFHDARFLQQVTELVPAADRTSQVTFRTKIPGRTRLRFMLVPAAPERAVAAVDAQELILVIR